MEEKLEIYKNRSAGSETMEEKKIKAQIANMEDQLDDISANNLIKQFVKGAEITDDTETGSFSDKGLKEEALKREGEIKADVGVIPEQDLEGNYTNIKTDRENIKYDLEKLGIDVEFDNDGEVKENIDGTNSATVMEGFNITNMEDIEQKLEELEDSDLEDAGTNNQSVEELIKEIDDYQSYLTRMEESIDENFSRE